MTLTQWLAIAIGGALGSLARAAATLWLPSLVIGTARFPLSVLLVNFVGSLAIGVAYVVLVEPATVNPVWRQFFIAGCLGGFTTFSAFSLDTLQLLFAGQVGLALLYVGLSVGLGLGAAFAGYSLAQKFL